MRIPALHRIATDRSAIWVNQKNNQELRGFCFSNQPNRVLVTQRNVTRAGQFRLLGQAVFYSTTCSGLYLAIREEGNNKILYGWEREEDLLNYNRCNIKVAVLERSADGAQWCLKPNFEVLSRSRQLMTLAQTIDPGALPAMADKRIEVGRMLATGDYVDFCFRDAGGETFEIGWRVIQRPGPKLRHVAAKRLKGNNACIEVPDDFDTHELFSATAERGRFKVVRFWRTVAEKDRGAPPFAFRLVTFRGPTGDWRIFWAQLDDFHALKQLIFKDELGPDELIKELTAMAREYPAVFPEAISDWSRQDWIRQLNNALPSPRERAKMTAALQRYLFSTANGKTFPATWRAYHMRHPDGFVQSEARRKILGELLILPLPLRFPLGEIPSLSREYGGRFKWIDFWLSPESCKTGARPFATRFIGFKPAGERWQLFWRQLDDWKAFRQLVWDGKITVDELENILTEISYDRTEILPLLDKLYFSENIFSRRKKC